MHTACIRGKTEAATILIKYGAKIMSKDKKGMNTIHHAATGEEIYVSFFSYCFSDRLLNTDLKV